MKKRPLLLKNHALSAAREIAQGYVRAQLPDMQGIEPHVSARKCHHAHPRSARLSSAAPMEPAGYIFTFRREVRTTEGYTLSLIARVTVDAHQHVVKAVMSK